MASGKGLTPMMAQYRRVKDQHSEAIVFFRLGDFYETFFDDAAVVARELEITLTSREAGKGRRVPMAGIPHHAAEGYIARLLEKGHRVAICDQVEPAAKAKGLVRREVTRVITPGTALDARALDDRNPNYLAVAVTTTDGRGIGLAVCDYSTGEFSVTSFAGPAARDELGDELGRLAPREALLDPGLMEDKALAGRLETAMTLPPRGLEAFETNPARAAAALCEALGTVSLAAFGIDEDAAAALAAQALLAYLRSPDADVAHITGLHTYRRGDFMSLDAATRRNLDLVVSSRDGKRHGSLLWAVDDTVTAMGARTLRGWLLRPLTRLEPLQARQGAVTALVADPFLRAEVRAALKGVADLQRLVGRAGAGVANARDLAGIADAIALVPDLGALLAAAPADGLLRELGDRLDPHTALLELLRRGLAEAPPAALNEGGVIRDGFDAEVDRLRDLRRGAKGWLAEFEAKQRVRTGIKSLKVGYNRVFGYYLEVTRANLDAVPDDFVRRQTLAGAERFVTPELKQREAEILGAEEKLFALEYELFCGLRAAVAAASRTLLDTAAALAELDCLAGLAQVAEERGYCRPKLGEGDRIRIGAGRHPVMELILPAGFVPNDLDIGGEDAQLFVITGPNMAGKSTYLRQAALIVLLAQVGSFVPAESAEVDLVDRIFTRIGARDDLLAGQSTFMVEMQEVAHILHHASRRSLVILDEVGRGTSTFDGISLAQAVIEHLSRLGARTLFATHYHEVIALAGQLANVANYSTAVHERDGKIVFAHKVRPGGADRSYGIEVARLAGLPGEVLARARALLAGTEVARQEVAAGSGMWLDPRPAAAEGRPRAKDQAGPGKRGAQPAAGQVSFIAPEPSPVLAELRGLDVYGLTPLEALNTLARLQESLAEEER